MSTSTIMQVFPVHLKRKASVLCLSAGSQKGSVFLGMLFKLNLHFNSIGVEFEFEAYIGSSIGAVICFMLLIGISPAEIFQITIERQVGINNILSMIREYKESMFTFEELYNTFKKDITMATFNLTNKQTEYLNRHTYPHMTIIQAIQMTICVPLSFLPVKYNNCTYIDGAICDIFPIEYAIKHYPGKSILGIGVYSTTNESYKIEIAEYITSIMNAMIYNTLEKLSRIRQENVDICVIGNSHQGIIDMFEYGIELGNQWIEGKHKKIKVE